MASSALSAGALAVARPRGGLLRALLWLALPVWAEQALHMLVGLNDTYLANHLRQVSARPAATAAVGTISYVLWSIGLIIGAIGTGSTAIIARAIGARHRSLANSVCGQSVAVGLLMGLIAGAAMLLAAGAIARLTGLQDEAHEFALAYLRMLSPSLPFVMVMLVSAACLRGAGDTYTAAKVMIAVDIINMVFSFGLTYGWGGLPEMGFNGIAAGTVIAYVAGGIIQVAILLAGVGGIRLFVHRLRPHWYTLKRILRIGIPSGIDGALTWLAQFSIIIIINAMDRTNTSAAAHNNAVRIESISYLSGFAFATAAATLVGQSLGMRDPERARRSAHLAYAIGGGVMAIMGLLFIVWSGIPARWLSANDQIAQQTAMCLWLAGFAQIGFAAAMIFGGALRGAGDTFSVMLLNLGSIVVLRLGGVLIVTMWLGLGLTAVWVVLCSELMIRGVAIWGRFAHGGWKHARV